MLKPSDFKVGDIVTIQPLPRQEGLYLYQHQDFGLPARVMTYHTVPAFQIGRASCRERVSSPV